MNNYLNDIHRIQASVKASRVDITPVLGEWMDHSGTLYTQRHKMMIEARGADGSYVRGFTTLIMGEKE